MTEIVLLFGQMILFVYISINLSIYDKIMLFLLKFLVTALGIFTFVRFRPAILAIPMDRILGIVLIAGLVSLAVLIVLNLMKQSKKERKVR